MLSKSRESFILALILLMISGLMIFDIIDDLMEGVRINHLLLEFCMVTALLWGVTVALKIWKNLNTKVSSLNHDLIRIQSLYETEKKVLSEGLHTAIDDKYEEWSFTPAEKEVATLILKGLSLKEISEIRNTSERTVRQQAQCVYSKSKLAGRAELSAYFLEDLL